VGAERHLQGYAASPRSCCDLLDDVQRTVVDDLNSAEILEIWVVVRSGGRVDG